MFVCYSIIAASWQITSPVAHRVGESEIFFIEATNLCLIMSNVEQMYVSTCRQESIVQNITSISRFVALKWMG